MMLSSVHVSMYVYRYGHMETVDHGKGFVDFLVTSIVHTLEDRSGLRRTQTIIE